MAYKDKLFQLGMSLTSNTPMEEIFMEESKEGWICPVCKTVKAPSVKMCKPCSKELKESGDSKDSLLLG